METDKSKQYSVEDLLKKVSIDGIYFEATHGGISFGGGEPLLQAEFISEFIDQAPVSWNYLIETSLAVPFEKIEKVATKIGKFVVDIKSLDKNIYKQYTGLDLELAYTNLLKLKEMIGSERIRVRVPLIPGFADEKSQEETIAKLFELGFTDIDAFQYIIKK
jgi:pyruvate formate lyase activating enzyme